MRLRISLMIAYLLFSMLVGWMVNVAGHGFSQPAFVLGSWAFLPLPLLYKNDWWLTVIIGSAIFVLYLFGLMMLNNLLKRIIRLPIPIIPILIHLNGVLVCLMALGNHWPERLGGGYDKTPLAWILPAVFAFSYFFLEWQLALRSAPQMKRVGTSAGQAESL